jgi:multidrug resistance efflux pump
MTAQTGIAERSARAEDPLNAQPRGRRNWTAWLLVLLIVAAAVVGGRYLIERRHREATAMILDSAVLGAQQIPVGPADAATVASVQVVAGDIVRAGQTLAQLSLPASAAGNAPANSGVLVAPADGVVVTIDRPAGSVVKAGEPVVTEYASASLTFLATVSVSRAQKLKVGMAVSISGPGLTNSIKATVGAAQPKLDGSAPNVVDLKLIPANLADVRGLVPGLAFRATVTLTGYPKDAAPVLGGGP